MRLITNFIRPRLRWEFSAFVLWFSTFTLLSVIFYTFGPSFRVGFYELYTAGIVLAAFFASLAAAISAPAEKAKLDRTELGLGCLIFLFGLGLGLYRIDFYSVWLDEEVQAFSTRAWPGFSIVGRSVLSQQMPLGYFFTALNWDLAGANEWGLRLLPCLFIAGSGVLFFRIAKRLCRSPLIYSAGSLIYLLNPWIIRYSQEGRPYGLMMFCCLLWMNSVYDLFFASESKSGHLRHSLVVFTCSLFFLLSASFQPIIFCASFVFALSIVLLFPSWRKKTVLFLGAVGIAVLAVVPLIILARGASLQFLHSSEHLGSWVGLLPTISALTIHAKGLFLEQSYFLALVFIFAPLTLARPGKREHGTLWAGMAACLVFGVVFFTAYSVLIDYPLFVRYFISLYPLGLLLILAYFDQMSSFFGGGNHARYMKLGWQIVFVAALMASPLKALPEVYYSKKYDRWNVDFKSIYHYFRQTGWPGDVGYTIPFVKPTDWEQTGFLGTDFYYRENFPVRVLSYRRNELRHTASDLILKDLSGPPPRQAYFIFQNLSDLEAEIILNYCGSTSGVESHAGDRFLICKVSAKDGLAKATERFFSGLLYALGETEKAYRIYDILLQLAEFEKNPSKCLTRLRALKSLNSKSERIQHLIQFHEGGCAKIKSRANDPRKTY